MPDCTLPVAYILSVLQRMKPAAHMAHDPLGKREDTHSFGPVSVWGAGPSRRAGPQRPSAVREGPQPSRVTEPSRGATAEPCDARSHGVARKHGHTRGHRQIRPDCDCATFASMCMSMLHPPTHHNAGCAWHTALQGLADHRALTTRVRVCHDDLSEERRESPMTATRLPDLRGRSPRRFLAAFSPPRT